MALSAHVPDLGSMELLLAVARTGSLGAAGRELGLTQQAVSARIRTVEKLVGVAVLHRSSRGSVLTTAGALLADWAMPVLRAAEALDAGIGALRGQRDAHLDVAASFTIAEYLLPGWLVELRAEMAAAGADTSVNLVVRNSDRVAEQVLAREAGLGFIEGPHTPVGLSSVIVGRDELILVVPRGHDWARRRAVRAEELAATALVTREVGSGTRRMLDEALVAATPDTAPVAPALVLAATTSVRQAVLAGAGPAVLSDLAVREDIRSGRLAQVRVVGVRLRRELRGVWPQGPRPAGPARALLRIAGTATA